MAQFGVSYYGNRYLPHAKSDFKRIAACSDYIVHTVSETDLAFYKAALSRLFSESRKAGLEVWADPWGLGGVFGGEALSRFLLDHRDAWQIMSDGKITPVACLNRREWRDYVKEWVLSVKDMGAQVIFWDEPHISFTLESEMAGIYSCVCDICKAAFKRKYGTALPNRLNPATREFRRDTMKDFLKEMVDFSAAKNLKNALCLYAYKGNPEFEHMWKEAAALKNLDILGCDPYWRWHGQHRKPETHVRDFANYLLEHAKPAGKKSQIWIQAMRLPAGAEKEIPQAIEAALEEGVTHIAAWSYDGGALLEPVLSERPEEVWKAVEEAYTRFRSSHGRR